MRRARPYRGENSGPGKDDRGEFDTQTPELENTIGGYSDGTDLLGNCTFLAS
jgi:hypothetical protein